MNYKLHYDNLVKKAQTRSILDNEYKEIHHIIPRCMNGTNDVSNLIALFPEEHLLAHLLLHKIYPTNKHLLYAANMMTNMRRVNNKSYGWVKRNFSKDQKGKVQIVTEETKIKQRATWKKKYADGYVNPGIGKPTSDKQKESVRIANTGKTVKPESRSDLNGYILRYGEEEGNKLYKLHSKSKAVTIEKMIYKYGEEEGTKKYITMREKNRLSTTGSKRSLESKSLMSNKMKSFFEDNTHHSKDTFWITDGIKNQRWDKEELPIGFKKGRTFARPRKPSKPPMTIFDKDGNPFVTILSHYQKEIKRLNLPSDLYLSALSGKPILLSPKRPCDITKLTNSGMINYIGWYATYSERQQ